MDRSQTIREILTRRVSPPFWQQPLLFVYLVCFVVELLFPN